MSGQGVGEHGQVTTKRRTKCGETKPLEEFSPDRRLRDGKQSRCKACRSERQRHRYENLRRLLPVCSAFLARMFHNRTWRPQAWQDTVSLIG